MKYSLICKICNRTCNKLNGLITHICLAHKISSFQYLTDYEKIEIPKCSICEKDVKIEGFIIRITCGSQDCIKKSTVKSLSGKPGHIPTEEVRKKISASRIKYLKEHLDQVPYLLNHSSKQSYPEKVFEDTLTRLGIKGWVSKYRNSLYQYDFAFPNLKIDVEIDGSTHNNPKVQEIDERRDKFSISEGWKVIRFDAKSVIKEPETCVKMVQHFIETEIPDFITKVNLPIEKKLTNNEIYSIEVQKRKNENLKIIENKIRIIKENNIDCSTNKAIPIIKKLLNISRSQAYRLFLKIN